MRATVMYGAGDVRVEQVPDASISLPTDAVVRVVLSCVCGSDLWPYASLPASGHGCRMGHEFLGVVEDVGRDIRSLKPGDVVVAPFVGRQHVRLLPPGPADLVPPRRPVGA